MEIESMGYLFIRFMLFILFFYINKFKQSKQNYKPVGLQFYKYVKKYTCCQIKSFENICIYRYNMVKCLIEHLKKY